MQNHVQDTPPPAKWPIRPILGVILGVIGRALRALATLRPLQLGFNGQGACELAGTTLQACLDTLGPSGDWACLCVDIANAFNTVERVAILASLRSRAPRPRIPSGSRPC